MQPWFIRRPTEETDLTHAYQLCKDTVGALWPLTEDNYSDTLRIVQAVGSVAMLDDKLIGLCCAACHQKKDK